MEEFLNNTAKSKEKKLKEPKDIVFFDPPIHTDQNLEYSRLDDNLKGQEIPKGAHSIASYLQKNNIKTSVVVTDSFLKTEKYSSKKKKGFKNRLMVLLQEKIEHFDPKVIALNLMYTFTEPMILEMSKFIKEKYPKKKVIVGGNHATFCSDYLLDTRNKTGIDIVVKGEGEWTIKELMKELDKNDKVDLSKIDGISYLDEDKNVIHNKPRKRGDLKSLPPLDYLLIHKPKEVSVLNFNHTVMFARACKGNCSFCTSPEMWKHKVDNVSTENFQKELEFLLKNRVDIIGILDDDIMVTKSIFKKITTVLIDIKNKYPKANFLAQTRVSNLIDKKHPKNDIINMKKAGISRLYLGIESGSQTILNNMKKGIKISWIKEACRNIKKFSDNNIQVGAFWLFGHPGATIETEEESLRFLEELLKEGLIDDLEVHNTIPFPGTAISKDARINVFDHDKKHYGFLNNYPVYDLVDPKNNNKIILSAKQIKDFLDRALKLREKYLKIPINVANKLAISN